MAVEINHAIFTGIVYKSGDEISKLLDAKLESLLDSKELNFVHVTNIVNPRSKDPNWPDVAVGILEKKFPESGSAAHTRNDPKEKLRELSINEENKKKLIQLFKKIGLGRYVDKIKTYEIQWFS